MVCPRCRQENPHGIRFCTGCRASLNIPVDIAASEQSDGTDGAINSSLQPHRFSQGSWAFVGRHLEMEELETVLQEALSGQSRLVMLSGEPGIGKTRTARELATHAEMRGFKLLWGRCYEEEGAPPYWPWVQVIRSYIRQCQPDQLRSDIGPGAVDIVQIVPELLTLLPNLKAAPQMEAEPARFRLLDSITTFLRIASLSQPLMLVLDDLQWADKSSLLMLQFLASQIEGTRLLTVGCYRNLEAPRQHPLTETLAQLSRESLYRDHQLQGLNLEDTDRLVMMASGISPPKAVLETIHNRTGGNPFFLTELIRLLEERGELEAEGLNAAGAVRVPPSVRNAVGQRLNRRSEQCNRMLVTAAIIGGGFSFDLLQAVIVEGSEESLLEALEEALAAGVIEELPGEADRYQFTHALIQETLASELSAARRARLHARIGEALEGLYGAAPEIHAGELAYQFAAARSVIGTDKQVHYSLLAGEQALAAYAWNEALNYFQRGLEAKEGQPMDAETAALLFGLGRVQLATLEPLEYEEALSNLHRAFDYYAEAGDIDRAVAVAQSPVQASPLTGHRTGVIELVQRALSLVPSDSHEAGRLLCQYGNTLYYETGDYEGAREALSRALVIAQRGADLALEMRSLVAAGHAAAYHLRFQETLECDLRAIELASQVDEPFEETHARQEVASVLHRTGDLEGARRQAEAMLPVAERLRHRTRLWQALQANTTVAFLEGDWPTARGFSDRALLISPRNPNLLGYRAIIEYMVGDLDQGGSYLERLLDVMQRTSSGPTFEYVYPAMVLPLVAHISGTDVRSETIETAALLTQEDMQRLFSAIREPT